MTVLQKTDAFLERTQGRFEEIKPTSPRDWNALASDYAFLLEAFPRLLATTKALRAYLEQQVKISGQCCYTKNTDYKSAQEFLESLK